MLSYDVVLKLTRACPKEWSWPAPGEPYGPYKINPYRPVNKVLYAVTATNEVVDEYYKGEYDLLITHHPIQAGGGVPQLILHTALDCCPGGMNDQWRDVLKVTDAQHFDINLGWSGKIEPISFGKLCDKVENYLGEPIFGEKYSEKGPDSIVNNVVICSGLGGLVTKEARATGADCYLLGELWSTARFSGFKHVIEIGHTLSESKPGYNFVKNLLEPEGIQVDRASTKIDYFGHEKVERVHFDEKLWLEEEDLTFVG